MTEPLDENDRSELERRRMTEAVARSVEETLKKRYTWLAIVVSFLLGGGAVFATNLLTKPAERMLTRHEILLAEAEKSLTEVNKLTKSAREKLNKFRETIAELNKDILGVSEGKKSLNRRLIETLEEVKRITERVDYLTESVSLLSKGQNISIQPSNDIARSVGHTLDKTLLSQYTIYLHYENEKDKSLVSEVADHLKDLGYAVPKIRRVDYKVNDIRYYHKKDMDAAFKLQKNVTDFLGSKKVISVELSPEYFGERYSNVREGVIELWLNFS